MTVDSLTSFSEIVTRLGSNDVRCNRAMLAQYVHTQQGLWASPQGRGWLLLPYFRSAQGLALVGADDEALRRGLETVTAFFGRRFSANSRSTFVRSESLGTLPTKVFGGDHSPDELDALLERALHLVDLVATEPANSSPLPTSVPVLLRDYALSLEQADYSDAETILAAIGESGLLSATNLRFLEVGLLATGGRWYELRNLPDFEDLTHVRRPRLVSEHLANAIWNVDLQRSGDAEFLFRAYLDRRTGDSFGLFLDELPIQSSSLLEGPALLAALRASEVGDHERLKAIGATTEATSVRTVVATSLGSGVGVSGYEGNRASGLNTIVEIDAAINSGDVTQARDVLARIESSALVKPTGRAGEVLIAELRRLAREVPSGWTDWLAVDPLSIGDFEWVQMGRDQSMAWTRQVFQNPADLDNLADAMVRAFDESPDRLCMAFDVLAAMSVEVASRSTVTGPLEAMLTLASLQESPGKQVLDAHETLVSALLSRGADLEVLGRIQESVEVLMPSAPLAYLPNWLLNSLDMLLDSAPMSARDQVAELAGLIVPVAISTWTRWSPGERVRCRLLLRECGLEDAIQEVLVEESPTANEDELLRDGLRDTVVGLYSLSPRIISRFDEILRSLGIELTFQANSEYDASRSLEAFASRCDWLIVDIWHAKHEATNCINSVRPRVEQVIPTGRGGTGMFLALRDAVLREAGAETLG